MKRCSFVCTLKNSLAAAVGSARRFFLLCSTRMYHGPLEVSVGVLYPAPCLFSRGPISEAGTEKRFTQRDRQGTPTPQPVSRDTVHWDASSVAMETWLIVSEFTQAWSTIRQDGFLNCGIMRPGCPEGIWQIPRGGLSRRGHTVVTSHTWAPGPASPGLEN